MIASWRFWTADTPANKQLFGFKSSGYDSDPKCHIEGTFIDGVICFPYTKKRPAARTHQEVDSF